LKKKLSILKQARILEMYKEGTGEACDLGVVKSVMGT